jgi:hypothetical protein
VIGDVENAGVKKQRLPDQETLLEIGLVTFLGATLSGLAMLLYGGVVGGARRDRRHRLGPPEPGSVPDERHQHIAAVPPR